MKIEKDVLEIVYRKYYKQIYLYLFSLCGNGQVAEDLAQETFFRAFCSLEKSGENILPWLYRVGKNLHIDYWRKEKYKSDEEVEKLVMASSENVLATIILTEEKKSLYEAIFMLPEKEREIIQLFYFAELGQKQIARQLGLSAGNVRVLLHRAKLKLRRIMESRR